MKNLIFVADRTFTQIKKRNKIFMKKINKYQKEFNIHQKYQDVTDQKVNEYVANTPKQKLAQTFANTSNYNNQLKTFIQKFNMKHKNEVSLLDFSQYSTQFGELKNVPLKKSDIDLLKEFQKRKIDARLNSLKEQEEQDEDQDILNSATRQKISYEKDNAEDQYTLEKIHDQSESMVKGKQFSQGPLKVQDDFVMYLLNVGITCKSTTLNRINSFRVLLFMGNGSGVISRGTGKDVDLSIALHKGFLECKRNLIAIPRDPRVTVPFELRERFQDYRLYIKPIPGFNSYGHPIMASMLTAAGMDHCRFHVSHTEKNVYNVCNVFYKAVTKNTTPKQLAERQGFKVYRHQFIKPLTEVQTHRKLAG